jgi:hypothetical protein
MNLQICFMNETASDSESPNSDSESQRSQPLPQQKERVVVGAKGGGAGDFVAKQAQLQAGARQALAQAKEVARLQLTRVRIIFPIIYFFIGGVAYHIIAFLGASWKGPLPNHGDGP